MSKDQEEIEILDFRKAKASITRRDKFVARRNEILEKEGIDMGKEDPRRSKYAALLEEAKQKAKRKGGKRRGRTTSSKK